MLSYRKKYFAYHHYVSAILEDIFSATLGLPFTITSFYFGLLLEIISQKTPSPVVQRWIDAIWQIMNAIIIAPLFIFKGMVQLTIAPILATLLATKSLASDNDLPHYRFYLGKAFQISATFFLIPLMFISRYVMLSILLLTGSSILLPTIALLFLEGLVWKALGAILPLYLHNILKSFGSLLVTCFAPFYLISSPMLNWMIALAIPLQPAILLGIGIGASLLFLESRNQFLSRNIGNIMQFIIDRTWQYFTTPHLSKSVNKKDTGLDDLKTISPDKLFFANSGHTLHLKELQSWFRAQGALVHPYFHEHYQFDRDDIYRLSHHHKLYQFPGLKNFLAEHKNDINHTFSKTTIQVLQNLAEALEQPEDTESFFDNISKSADAYHTHLASLSSEDKQAVENLNMGLGQTFSTALQKTVAGNYCKKGLARQIQNTLTSIQNPELDRETFWQKNQPMHFVL